ncbi:MAG: TonB-dependent receptor [Planctomycetes bacterium]|nr:TonB-dependent receptor [Planctomycetota bacterium]
MPRPSRASLAVLASLAVACPAFAADPAPEPAPGALAEATEVLVTATRRTDPSFDVPWSATVTGSDEILHERLRRTLPDALLDVPGVMVQKTGYGQASPFIRGFTGYHTVLLVDGIRVNNSTFRSGPNQYWSTVDAFTVDRLETVRGPASVLYGSDAVGGVVNAVLRRRTSFEPGLHSGGRTYLRYATAEDSWTTRAEFEGNLDQLGVIAGFNYKAYGDFRAGDDGDRQPQTGYREQDGDLRLDFNESSCSVWTFGHQHVNQDDVPRTHRTLDAVPYHGTTIGDELRRDLTQTRDLTWLRNRRHVGSAIADDIEWTVSFQQQNEDQERDRDTTAPRKSDVQGYDVSTWGFQVQAEKATDIGMLTYGVESWNDTVDSYRRDFEDGVKVLDRIQGPVADDASYRLLGVYLQDEFTVGATTITAGARWTKATAEADEVDNPLVGGGDPATPGNIISIDGDWSTVVGSLRASHKLSDSFRVFGGVSQGFRAPNLSDLTRLDDTSGVETPSPDLDEEKFVQAELGLKARADRWSGQVGFWHTWIKDLIVPSPTGGLVGSTPEVRKDNVGDGWATGIEAELSYRLTDEWTAGVTGTWQEGEVDQLRPSGATVRRPLSRMMPVTGTIHATYHEGKSPWRMWVAGRFADKQDDLSLKDDTDSERIPAGGTPGYGVWSVGGSWSIDDYAVLSLALENVFDRDYRIHGSGTNELGRNLVLAIDVKF